MRIRTPPELKWLLVERATLAGDLAKLTTRLAVLEAETARVSSTLAALDTAIRLTEAKARPDAAGVIQRHCGNYGARGALKAFIITVLQDSPDGISTRNMAVTVRAHFGLYFVSEPEFTHFLKASVRSELRRLAKQGLAVTTRAGGPGTMRWTWKTSLPTLAELALLAGAAPAPCPVGRIDDNQDSSGHQVAHQRGSDAAG